VGLGHVGRITQDLLGFAGSTVIGYDRSSGDAYPTHDFASCDFIVVCVNTPSQIDGSADLSQIDAAFAELPESVPVILRSTVPPGSCEQLASIHRREVIFWPEYLGESRFASQDWAKFGRGSAFQVLGSRPGGVLDAFVEHLGEILGPEVRIHRVGLREAELIKYMENCYFAMKVTFVNEFRKVAEHLGADWHDVREGWLLDPRVERDHTAAFRSFPGYGGKCLPKDVSAIVSSMHTLGCRMPVMEAVQLANFRSLHEQPDGFTGARPL